LFQNTYILFPPTSLSETKKVLEMNKMVYIIIGMLLVAAALCSVSAIAGVGGGGGGGSDPNPGPEPVPIDPDQEDPDNDGLKTIYEYTIGTDPYNPDTDGDGLIDSEEMDDDSREPFWQQVDSITDLDRLLAKAKGWNSETMSRSIYLLRPTNEMVVAWKLDISELLQSQSVPLMDGDRLYVAPTWLARWHWWWRQAIPSFLFPRWQF